MTFYEGIMAIIGAIDTRLTLVLLVVAFIIVAAMVFVMRLILPLIPFFYSNARVQAKRGGKLMPEISASRSTREFHMLAERSFFNLLDELIGFSPKQVKPMLSAYFGFYEAAMLKSIYSAKLHNRQLKEGTIHPIGTLTKELLSQLMKCTTVADVRTVMQRTIYRDVFIKDYASLEDFEAALDNFVMQRFEKSARESKVHDWQAVVQLVHRKADCLNFLALMRFILRKVPEQKRRALIIPVGQVASRANGSEAGSRADELIKAKTIGELVDGCEGLEIYSALSAISRNSAPGDFERALTGGFSSFVRKFEGMHPFGPVPLFAYIFSIEAEKRNMFAMSKGVALQ